jgi:hypothetical protein
MRRKKNNMNFTSYEQTLFGKYEIDEVYLQTGKQKRVCLELLEKIDKNEAFDEKKLMEKISEAFRGTGCRPYDCITKHNGYGESKL